MVRDDVIMAGFNRAEQLTDAFAEKLNAKDPAALGELFTEDAEFVNIMGMRMRGRQGIDAGTTDGSAMPDCAWGDSVITY